MRLCITEIKSYIAIELECHFSMTKAMIFLASSIKALGNRFVITNATESCENSVIVQNKINSEDILY